MNDPMERHVASRVASSWWRTVAVHNLALLVLVGGLGCSLDGLVDSDQLPLDASDPRATETPEGARTAYIGTLAQFRSVFGGAQDFKSFIVRTGQLTDELQSVAVDSRNPDDRRDLRLEGLTGDLYSRLQQVRGQASQTIGLLRIHLPEKPALVGHLYAIQGYVEIFLAELYCSGVPLSTVDYGGDFTYQPGSTTKQVFAHAAALFDTALALAGDSARVMGLARVGRGRALLANGEYAAAAGAVAPVDDSFHYDVHYSDAVTTISNSVEKTADNFASTVVAPGQTFSPWTLQFHTVADREGGNGLDYRTSGDPRTQTTQRQDTYHPNKYDITGASPIVLASAVEARLIEAEAALQANPTGDTWLTTLNRLRTDGTQDGSGNYNPGVGGVAGLGPLSNPSTDSARVSLLFRERAFWLFLTGHRQGDLRRLIRQYGSNPRFYPNGLGQHQVYPVGPYPFGSVYGSDVTVPVPSDEFLNPLYTGCVSQGA